MATPPGFSAGTVGPVVQHDQPVVVIAVGDELLGGFTVDTNSAWLAGRCREAGWPVRRIEVVGDDREDIGNAVRRAVADPHALRVLVCGGLGPTPDDRTLEAVAAALGLALEENPIARDHVEAVVARLHEAGRLPSPTLTPANLKMAMAPHNATVLGNPAGMAPSISVSLPGPVDRVLVLLPGVPRELRAIVDELVVPQLLQGRAARALVELEYRDIPEAQFAPVMQQLAVEYPGVGVGSYPQETRRHLIIRLQGADPEQVEAAAARLQVLRPPLTQR
ncbi:MAG: competence/damage-inducible protein A [Candidatus Dormibacteria bacterium]